MKRINIFEIKSKINTIHEIRIWKKLFGIEVVAIGLFEFDCFTIYSGYDLEKAITLYLYFREYRNDLRRKENIKWKSK